MYRLPGQPLHQLGQATAVLGADPVQFEAVGDKKCDPRQVVGHLGGQWFDPGLKLLFG